MRDPFYREIEEGLAGKLDPDLFEECAADLLRKEYPGLSLVKGGADAGMDGAIPDGMSEAFPLICTTAQNVIDNLTRNLKSYKRHKTARKAVLVTSQALTPTKRRNLERRAHDLGFVLLNVHDRTDIAYRLYREPAWCHQLLGLTGNPPPISDIPPTNRPLLDQPLIGREADLGWLGQGGIDRALAGQPGSGKTFLLSRFAATGNAFFVVSSDMGEIASGVRSLGPKALIVDDAHGKKDLLASLCHLRQEIHASFAIIATSWPGEAEDVAQTLLIPESEIRFLQLLTRDEVVQVIKHAGLHGPDELIREIVNQAEGKPGLAVTLAHLCLRGDVQNVLLGDALSRSVESFFRPSLGSRTVGLLAAFGIGGDAGMTIDAVAKFYEVSVLDVQYGAVQLAAGGVINQVRRNRLAVRPPALRHALVRDVFFKGATSIDCRPLVQSCDNVQEVVITTIGARARGAQVPEDWLRHLLENASSQLAWKQYAWLGPDEARYALNRHPELLKSLAEPALHHAPGFALPKLLESAIGDHRELGQHTGHPLRLIQDWVKEARPESGEAVQKRKDLLAAVASWLEAGHDLDVALHALSFAFSPVLERVSSDPGAGLTVTIRQSLLTASEIDALRGAWLGAFQVVAKQRLCDWRHLFEMVKPWAYPGSIPMVSINEELRQKMQGFARQMLLDLCVIAQDRPGVLHEAKVIADDTKIRLDIELNKEFEILFPRRDFRNWDTASKRQLEEVSDLAGVWMRRGPRWAARRLAALEREAQRVDLDSVCWTPELCNVIAGRSRHPLSWAQAVIDAGCRTSLVLPFIQKAAEQNEQGWKDPAMRCLDNPDHQASTALLLLQMPNLPIRLLGKALLHLEGCAKSVEYMAFGKRIPIETLKRLLQHEDPCIARAAATGEWANEPRGTVRQGLRRAWRSAILAWDDDDYWLAEMLKSDPSLARDWLKRRLKEDCSSLWRYSDAVKAAVGVLAIQARRDILKVIPATCLVDTLVHELVAANRELYAELLADDKRRRLHLLPLQGYPSASWIKLALEALNAGYTPANVADAAFGHMQSWCGNESDFWEEWKERFVPLLAHDDNRIQKVGQHGIEQATANKTRALQKERHEAIYGIT